MVQTMIRFNRRDSQSLWLPVPQEDDLPIDDDVYSNVTADEMDNQSDWDDNVNDDIREDQYEETVYEENDLIIEVDDTE